MPEISEKNINAFLHFGWLPRLDVEPPIPEDWIPTEITDLLPSTQEGANILRDAVQNSVGSTKEVVVPLSGGFDSRAMLAILDELGYNTTAVTLGVPGTFDYDIGALVAHKTGIAHEAINVNQIKLDTTELVSYAKMTGDWVNIIEVFYNLYITKKYDGTPIVSGFLGDFLAGTYAGLDFPTWDKCLEQFIKDNRVCKTFKLTHETFDPKRVLPQEPSTSLLNYEELVYLTRHTCTLRPTVYATDFGYKLPFRDKDWVNYILGCSREFRIGQKLYHDILLEHWPKFFSLPSKNFAGASISSSGLKKKMLSSKKRVRGKLNRTWPKIADLMLGIDPVINYTDFHNQIVMNENFRSILKENIADLEKRNCTPWIDLQKINERYFGRVVSMNYHESIMLLTLTNLEINLKASDH